MSTKEQPGESRLRRHDLRKGVYIVPSLLTTANIFCGFYSVLESVNGFQYVGLHQYDLATRHFNIAAMCIGWSVLFDFLDGRIARMANATSEFGVELDSIADVLSFGLAPAVLAYTWGLSNVEQMQKLAWAVSFLFLVCGALRLARFNVQSRKPAAQDLENPLKPAKKYFVGMPIPAGASLIAAIVHFKPIPLINRNVEIHLMGFNFDHNLYSVLLMVLMAVLALLMVSTVRYSSFKNSGDGDVPSKPKRSFSPVIIIAVLMFAIYQWSEIMLLVMATGYASLGPIMKLISLFRPSPPSITPEVGLPQQ